MVDVAQYLLNEGIRDATVVVSELLYDYIEDVSGATYNLVKLNYGVDVSDTVIGVTKTHGVDYKNNPGAMSSYVTFMLDHLNMCLVKVSDVVHNFGTLGATSPEKKLRKALEVETYYLPFLDECVKRYHWYANFFLGVKTTIEPHLNEIKRHHAEVTQLKQEIERLKQELLTCNEKNK